MTLKQICLQIVRKPRRLDVVMLFHSPASFVHDLSEVLDGWKIDEDQGIRLTIVLMHSIWILTYLKVKVNQYTTNSGVSCCLYLLLDIDMVSPLLTLGLRTPILSSSSCSIKSPLRSIWINLEIQQNILALGYRLSSLPTV